MLKALLLKIIIRLVRENMPYAFFCITIMRFFGP
nr:MAG TPA: hypothetical protein [Caudoviricetes sp.]DAU40812.1 MAG TPA: hypothetical protein [Caudoviricetes sp.]DAV10012.1 MAG TPA: hypothetical protein [Caudoviricetes sp.]